IKRVDLFGNGAEADGFLGVAHNARTITCIIIYYKTVCLKPVVEAQGHRLDERKGVGEAGAGGGSALRLCTLGAQSPLNAEGSI
ncbi:MAG: hypothetical protein WBW98_16970, partial [Candidatus Sulfotelmatobacter sp.]